MFQTRTTPDGLQKAPRSCPGFADKLTETLRALLVTGCAISLILA